MSTAISIDEQIACVERELRLRRKTYPRLVRTQHLTQRVADEEVVRMEAVRATLLLVRQSGPRQVVVGVGG